MAQYRKRIFDDERLLTAIVPGGLALSCLRVMRRPDEPVRARSSSIL
jgi:hypothetical protein